MKNLTVGAILIVIGVFLSVSIKTITNNHEAIQKSSHFERWAKSYKMKGYGWMVIKSDPDSKWKIRKRKLIRKE